MTGPRSRDNAPFQFPESILPLKHDSFSGLKVAKSYACSRTKTLCIINSVLKDYLNLATLYLQLKVLRELIPFKKSLFEHPVVLVCRRFIASKLSV